MDFRPRGRQTQAWRHIGLRPLGDALLPPRLGLPRRHALPLDDERLLAHGRHRVRHRQVAGRAGRRQHPRRRRAEVPQPVGHDRQEDAEKGQGLVEQRPRSAEPSGRALDRARRALWPLREDLQRVARREDRRPSRLHRRLQQHFYVGARLPIRLRLPATERRRNGDIGKRPAPAVPQFRRARQPPMPVRTRSSSTAPSSSPARRSTRISARWRRRKSSSSDARSSSGRATRRPATRSTTRPCCAK